MRTTEVTKRADTESSIQLPTYIGHPMLLLCYHSISTIIGVRHTPWSVYTPLLHKFRPGDESLYRPTWVYMFRERQIRHIDHLATKRDAVNIVPLIEPGFHRAETYTHRYLAVDTDP